MVKELGFTSVWLLRLINSHDLVLFPETPRIPFLKMFSASAGVPNSLHFLRHYPTPSVSPDHSKGVFQSLEVKSGNDGIKETGIFVFLSWVFKKELSRGR